MRALLCALCALCAAVPATLKDTVLTNTLDHGPTHGGSTGANTSTAAASPECALYPGLSSTWGEIGAHHPPGCRLVALPELRSQACAAVRFGSCVLDGRAARPCAECARPHQPDVVRASAPAPTTKRQEPLHLIVLSMPYSGSSALAGLFASSPEVATLCAANSHCEPTELLERAGVFRATERWWPPTEPLAYWSAAFGALESHWDHATRPIRLVKAPPDLAKVESLLAYFGARAIPYRFVALTQHPCLLTVSHRKQAHFNISAHYLEAAVRAISPSHLFVLSYESLLADTAGAAQALVDWLPELRELDLRVGLGGSRGGERGQSVAEYVRSSSCSRAIQSETAARLPREVEEAVRGVEGAYSSL